LESVRHILISVLAFVLLWGANVSVMADKADDLRRKLPSLKGTDRVVAYEQLYYLSLESGTLEEQLRCVNDYINETHRQGLKEGEVEARLQRAVLYYNNDMNDSVLTVVRKDMEFAKECGKMKAYYELWSRIANTYLFVNQNKMGLRETEAMYNDAKVRNNDYGMGLAYSIMGTAYNNMRNFDQCLEAFPKSISLLSSIKPLPPVLPDVYAYYGNALNDMKEYRKLEELNKRWKEFLEQFFAEHNMEGNPTGDVFRSYYYFSCVQAALGLGKLNEAEVLLQASRNYFNGLDDYEGMQWLYYMSQLRLKQGKFAEALDYNNQRMQLLDESADKSWSVMVMQQRAEIMDSLNRFDDAAHLYRQLYLFTDSANAADTKSQLTELNTIFQVSDLEMENERNRFRFIIIVASVIVVSLAIFLFFRIRSARRLKQAHGKLQVAYEDLKEANNVIEKTTAAKERIESELRIARDIQQSMVPAIFPDRPDLDLYASMTPAKEVGGDMYSYLLIEASPDLSEGGVDCTPSSDGERLYFALGDVSGKGVPASLFMAQATRLFRTLAKQQLQPAEIATRMNGELAEDNEQGMFITMFIGLLDLSTGHLDFCNAGHNPPVLIPNPELRIPNPTADNSEFGISNSEFLEMIPNAPIGLWPDLEYEGEEIENISGKPLFIYTDGLNEAENRQQEQFTDERLLEILDSTPFESSQQTIDMLRSEVEKHRDGADPNDDLTMMCVYLKK